MKKSERQRHIQEIISNQYVERQEDLVKLLAKFGIRVTQATISRDIKDMQLLKVPSVGGGYHYSLPARRQDNKEERLANVMGNELQEMKRSDRFVSLSMRPGNGPVAAMLINQMKYPTVFTAIGDDATVLIVCHSAGAAVEFERTLQALR